MSLSTQPDKHHRLDLNKTSNQIPPSLDGGLSDNLSNTAHCYLRHTTRVLNSANIDKQMETKINFPPSHDKTWCEINEELEIIIPKVFTNRQIDRLSTTELSQKFDSWLHNYFLQRFGKKETKVLNTSKRGKGQIKQ